MIGTTISHYRITEKLGEGGMGVVYKAEDTKLDRPVALKFLAAHLLANEEAKRRFIREAKAAAALDHPNICTLYEIDEVNGRTFMAMAYLEGRTLEQKIGEGPLPIEDALDIATQAAKGLQKAHAKRIYHRDIKPSNLVLVDEGPKERLVKIMDFGLAHLADQSKLTQKDTALGTPAYMSPEQTQGVPVDHRTDIWALGVVLYEMVVAQMPFKGEYQQAIFYTILHEDYEPLTGIRVGVPMDLEFIVSKCLAKDVEQRYQRAEDLIIDLTALREKLAAKKSTTVRKAPATHIAVAPRPEQKPPAAAVGTGTLAGPTELPTQPEPTIGAIDPKLSSPESSTESQPEPAPPQQSRAGQRAPWLVAGLATAVAIAFALLFFALETPPPPRSIVSAILPPEDVIRIDDLALSPDGEWLTFAGLLTEGETRLYLRRLDRPDTRSLDGTEGATYPFWSPDSRFIGFFADGKLKKIDISGGSPFTLADAPAGRGGAWSEDGVIVFAANILPPLLRVAAGGGPVSEVTELDAEGVQRSHRWPWFLPGGQRFLFHSSRIGAADQASHDLSRFPRRRTPNEPDVLGQSRGLQRRASSLREPGYPLGSPVQSRYGHAPRSTAASLGRSCSGPPGFEREILRLGGRQTGLPAGKRGQTFESGLVRENRPASEPGGRSRLLCRRSAFGGRNHRGGFLGGRSSHNRYLALRSRPESPHPLHLCP